MGVNLSHIKTGKLNQNMALSEPAENDDEDSSDFLLSGHFYGGIEFNPKEIIIQILVIQATYYAILSGLIFILYSLSGRSRNLSIIFDSKQINWDHGKLLISLILISSLSVSLCVSSVVERARKCLDFSATLHINHILLCWLCVGFPLTLRFWIIEAIATGITTYFSEYLCSRSELQEIIIHKRTSSAHTLTEPSIKSSALASPHPIRTRPTEPSDIPITTTLELPRVTKPTVQIDNFFIQPNPIGSQTTTHPTTTVLSQKELAILTHPQNTPVTTRLDITNTS